MAIVPSSVAVRSRLKCRRASPWNFDLIQNDIETDLNLLDDEKPACRMNPDLPAKIDLPFFGGLSFLQSFKKSELDLTHIQTTSLTATTGEHDQGLRLAPPTRGKGPSQ